MSDLVANPEDRFSQNEALLDVYCLTTREEDFQHSEKVVYGKVF